MTGYLAKRAKEPHLEPMFPVTQFEPGSTCSHHGPIRRGSSFVCMVCHKSGMDHHPALKRDSRIDTRPDPKPPALDVEAEQLKTRKQKRAGRFAKEA
jgi:hypothetical protein